MKRENDTKVRYMEYQPPDPILGFRRPSERAVQAIRRELSRLDASCPEKEVPDGSGVFRGTLRQTMEKVTGYLKEDCADLARDAARGELAFQYFAFPCKVPWCLEISTRVAPRPGWPVGMFYGILVGRVGQDDFWVFGLD